MTKGIYGYFDIKNKEVVYIGKDSNIDKNVRKYAHMKPSQYDRQPINMIVQNNPERYKYAVIYVCPFHLNEVDLNGLEMQYIQALKPKFNFTEGGEGRFGSKVSSETRMKLSEINKGKAAGKNNPRWIDYARVVKRGKSSTTGKKQYCLKYDGKVIKWSVNKEKLDKIAEEINRADGKVIA